MAVEFALIVAGSYLYWQAARQTVQAAGGGQERRAHAVAGLILAAGIVTVAVDVLVG